MIAAFPAGSRETDPLERLVVDQPVARQLLQIGRHRRGRHTKSRGNLVRGHRTIPPLLRLQMVFGSPPPSSKDVGPPCPDPRAPSGWTRAPVAAAAVKAAHGTHRLLRGLIV